MATLELHARLALKRILYLTDFSPCAASAMPYTLSLARHYGSKVILAHVLPAEPWPVVPHDPLPRALDPSYTEAERRMGEIVQSPQFTGIPCEVVLEKGDLWPALEYMLAKHEVDLIVLATHGRHGVRKLLLGSVAEEVFRHSSCPVLTVGPKLKESSPDFRSVLFATDFSAGSLHALPHAMAFAEEHRATLTLLHVLQESVTALETESFADAGERQAARARAELERLVPPHDGRPPLCEFVVERGLPAESILSVASRTAADLIVMGVRRAASALAATRFPWATAHCVVAQAPCPVLTVRG